MLLSQMKGSFTGTLSANGRLRLPIQATRAFTRTKAIAFRGEATFVARRPYMNWSISRHRSSSPVRTDVRC